MFGLLLKEIRSFLSSLIGYIVVIVFLVLTGSIMWLVPGNLNPLDSGYADIFSLFEIAPFIFLILIPAITMRSFAEEKKGGTMELLLTKPLTDMQIILAKYFAGVVLVIFSLLPTLVYFLSVYLLGNPVGNIDTGGTWGSFIGLLFIGGAFVSVGIFASSITSNQIVSFIVSIALCLFFWLGFWAIGSFDMFGTFDNFVLNLGIDEHYQSMSVGAIDSRDILYFLSFIAIFLLLTKTVLRSRNW